MELRQVSGEEEEAIHKLRFALQNPRGTNLENRERVVSAWQALRAVANSPDVEIKSQKRQRKRIRFEEKEKRKTGHTTIEGEHAEVRPAGLVKEAKNKILHEAAQMGQADRVRELVSLGFKVSSKDRSGYSALHWASLYGHVEVVRVLLSFGAGDGKRINRQNDAGNTALHLACIGRHAQVAAMLQIYKPDEYITNAYKESPVSLGLRELVEGVEKIRHLDDIQALRANSYRHLSSISLDWQMARDVKNAEVNDVTWKINTSKKISGNWGCWEEYDAGWKEFVDRFSSKSIKGAVRKSPEIGAVEPGIIHFQDVPWPVIGLPTCVEGHMYQDRRNDTQRLLLGQLGLQGAALRTLIQRERLRWHPDKFVQLFGRYLALEEKSAILAGVHTVCQLLNALADEAEEPGSS